MTYDDKSVLEYLGRFIAKDALAYVSKRLEEAVLYEQKWGELVETTAGRIKQDEARRAEMQKDIDNANPMAPAHYTQGSMQVIEAMRALMTPEEFRGHLKGCVFKYLFRYQHKGQKAKDLQKMMTYGTWLRQFETEGHITILPAEKKP